jgi:hypothetical protein
MILNQNPVVIFNQTLKYKVDCAILQGENLFVRIKDIPLSPTVNPYSYTWACRQEPAFINGIQDWSSGTLIQGNTGTLASTASTEVTITVPVPTGVASLAVGNYFSFTFAIDPDDNIQTGVQVVFYIYAVSSNPNSSPLVPPAPPSAQRTGTIIISSTDETNINFGGTGYTLPFTPTPSLFSNSLFFVNGQMWPTSAFSLSGNTITLVSGYEIAVDSEFSYRIYAV